MNGPMTYMIVSFVSLFIAVTMVILFVVSLHRVNRTENIFPSRSKSGEDASLVDQ